MNYIDFDMELNTLEKMNSYIITGIKPIAQYLEKKQFILSNAIEIKQAYCVFTRNDHIFNVQSNFFRYVALRKERNIIYILIDIMPFNVLTIEININDNYMTKMVKLEYQDDLYQLVYIRLNLEVKTRKLDKKRNSWWNR